MNDTEMERFVQHCEQCDECSMALWNFQKEKIARQDEQLSVSVMQDDNATVQTQNDRLIRRSLDLLEKLQNL
ncbi:MAG: hypothetical protein WCP20_08010 [Desulfuromonadales bacterium]